MTEIPNGNDQSTQNRKPWLNAVKIGFGVILFALVLAIGGADAIDVMVSADPQVFGLAVLLSLPLYPIVAWRWWIIALAFNESSAGRFFDFLRMRLLFAAGGFLGAREVVEFGGRVYWLNRHRGFAAIPAFQIVLLDRFCDAVISISALAVALIVFGLGLDQADGVLLTLIALILIIVLSPVLIRMFRPFGLNQPKATEKETKVKTIAARLAEAMTVAASVDAALVRWCLAISFVKFLLVALRVIVIALAVAIELPWQTMMLLVPAGQLAYLVALTPGGLGIVEAGWFGLLIAFGAVDERAAAFVVLLRICLMASILVPAPILFLRREGW